MSSCRRIAAYLDAFVDGELSTEQMLEVEAHLADCQTCAARIRYQRAVQTSVRQAVRTAVSPSDAFRARVAAALSAERVRESGVGMPEPSRMLSWRSIVPLAAAAAVALLWAASLNPPDRGSQSAQQVTADSIPVVDRLLDEFVDNHVQPPQPEVVEEAALQRLEPRVGVPVRAPSFRRFGGQWEGGGVVWVNASHSRAATLRYVVDGHRVTVYVYDAARIPLRVRLEPRVVGDVPVYVGTRRGYSIAAAERRGVGYAVATDLDDRESAELVAASF